MRKAAAIIGAVALLGALGWSGLWLAGRDEVRARIALERERLAAEGIAVEHAAPQIGGYPFAYRVAFGEVTARHRASGTGLVLPSLTAEAGAADPERLVFRFPARFTLELAATGPGEPGPVRVEAEAAGLVLEQTLASGPPAGLALRADSLVLTGADGGSGPATMELDGLEARLGPPSAPGPEARTAFRLTADGIGFLVSEEGEDGGRRVFDAKLADLSISGETDRRSPAGALALLMGASDGEGRLVLRAGPLEARGEVTGTAPDEGGALAIETGVLSALATVDREAMDLQASAENNRLTLYPADEAVRLSGGVGVDRMEAVYRAPSAPSEAMGPLAIRVALGLIRPDAEMWARLDPEGVLPREPGELVVDLAGAARLDPAAAVPEIGRLEIRDAALGMFGARVGIEGALAFDPPGERPDGTLTARLTRVMPLIGELVRVGLIDIATAQMLTAFAANYTRPGTEADELVTEIGVDEGTVTVNGGPIVLFGLP